MDFLHGDVLIRAGRNQYVATTVVGITDTGKYVFYDMTGMTPVNAETKEELSPAAAGTSAVSAIQESSSTGRVRSESKNVNRKFSPEMQERASELTDADAPALSEEEQRRETWRQMTREVDAEGERLREMERQDGEFVYTFHMKKREEKVPPRLSMLRLTAKTPPTLTPLIPVYAHLDGKVKGNIRRRQGMTAGRRRSLR